MPRKQTARAAGTRTAMILAALVLPAPNALADAAFHENCSSCHGAGTALAASAEEGGSDPCLSCHAKESEGAVGGHAALRSTRAEAAALSRCLVCHDPHEGLGPAWLRRASSNPALPLDPGSARCIDCHAAYTHQGSGTGKHPVGVPVTVRGEKTSGSLLDLPLVNVAGTGDAADARIACTTCHDVHASTHLHLLRWSRDEYEDGCSSCHLERKERVRETPREAALTTGQAP